MLIQKQYNKLILREIQTEQEIQQCFIYLKKKKTILDFSQTTGRLLQM